MTAYVGRRVALLIPPLLALSLVAFLVLHLAPGDPAQDLLGPLATPQQLNSLRQEMGLDSSVATQYFLWLGNAIHFDFGTSYIRHEAVAPYVMGRLGVTLILVGASLLISTVVGVLAGVLAGARRGTFTDRFTTLSTLLGLSMPEFWIGLMLILIFAVKLHWLPAGGMTEPGHSGVLEVLRHLVLPAVTLAGATTAVMTRVVRSSVLEERQQGFVVTAEAKGASTSRIYLVHVLRNALVPIVTLLGVQVGFLLSSDIITEYVFGWPGIGLSLINAINQRDYPIVQAAVVMIGLLYLVLNLVTDLGYFALDPRVRRPQS